MNLSKYLVISSLVFLTLPSTAFAQTVTTTPSTTIRDSVKQKVDEELNQIKSTVTKKAYLGTVTLIADGTLTLQTLSSQTRKAIIAPDAAIKLAGSKDGTPGDIKVGNFVLAMGDADGSQTLTVRRLLVIPKPATDKRQPLFGTVTKISSSSLTIKSITNTESALGLTSSTKYTGKTKAADIKVNSKIVLISNGTNSTLIHLLP